MAKNLLKNGILHDNSWVRYQQGETVSDYSIFALSDVLATPELISGVKHFALSLKGNDAIEELLPYLADVSFIAVEFPSFTDGRGYSIARMIRRNLKWNGELRAIGNVLADQYNAMLESGFDAFEIDVNRQPPSLFKTTKDSIGLKYQNNTSQTSAKNILQLRHQ